jgi:hypothetical protein
MGGKKITQCVILGVPPKRRKFDQVPTIEANTGTVHRLGFGAVYNSLEASAVRTNLVNVDRKGRADTNLLIDM